MTQLLRETDNVLSPRVLVIGGGIGGLALAAGLRRGGFDVTVFERDEDLRRTGGYHITLDPRAQEALAALVDPSVMQRLLASSAAVDRRDADAMWDHEGRILPVPPAAVAADSIDVDRITLRLLLADAVGADLERGRTFVRFERREGGVSAHFADGAHVDGDILVGADGAHSVVARALAEGPTNQPAGIVGISGRTPVGDLSAPEQQRLGIRSSFGVGPQATAVYVGYHDPVGHAAFDSPALRAAFTTEATYIWGAMFPDDDRTSTLRELSGEQLRDATVALLREHGWASHALEVITATAPDTLATYRFRAASTDPTKLAPWTPGNVTALGDAVHATPPHGRDGSGHRDPGCGASQERARRDPGRALPARRGGRV
ncbi:FAD-dependent monooxygenase [Microbacterium aurugineum]|uniref:FAD-dependent monooxygenase n=1 Tax=Microbacterium aurugineum TaxID=2851642 RepID=UPI0020C0430C|nr:FAD-dependent monooxygenase [Microbacterium aurugineum]MCK8475857.1 FAD-dependent monooxygenase [Microbacterium aurugineum]